jgi:hypothetical protein
MALIGGCAGSSPPLASTTGTAPQNEVAPPALPALPASAPVDAGTAEPDSERSRLAAWLKAGLPEAGELGADPNGAVTVIHTVQPGDSYASIAEAYVGLTDLYLPRDLAHAMQQQAHVSEGMAAPPIGARVNIPAVVQHPPKPIEQERLGWPEDHALRGLYVRGTTAASPLFIPMLERMAERGMNLIVLDTKDYDGFVSYASRAAVAVETGSASKPPLRDLPRTIRFAHQRGIRVAMRISSFEDEFVAKAKPSLCPVAKWGRPYNIGWLDPANEGAQGYVLELVQEAIAAGADEVQLDYIRYPVLGIKGADFDATKKGKKKTLVIRDFVRRVHELTAASHVMLSLDIFGIVAEGDARDIEALGQDPALLAMECEALGPMVYPSHYRPGYAGFEVPGSHPEIVGMATRKVLAMMGKHARAVVRPWLQGMDYKSPDYGPPYIASEIRSAEQAGSHGWMMWNPAQTYTVTWQAIPRDRRRRAALAAAASGVAADGGDAATAGNDASAKSP